jgi:Ca2+-binding RTX toxin-like protein
MAKNINGTSGKDLLIGTAEDEHIYGFEGADTLKGAGGNDVLDGGAGADTMIGGTGNDWYKVDQSGDVVKENADGGIDTVFSSINYTLGANVENLNLVDGALVGVGNELDNGIAGNDANNTLKGGGGDDNLVGGAGADIMVGGTGDDGYSVDQAGDAVMEFAGEGNDQVWSYIDYTLPANVEMLVLMDGATSGTGNELDNFITGNTGSNMLAGGAGDDRLRGSGFDGGDGMADTLIGGLGDDLYEVLDAGDVVIENANEGRDWVISLISYTLEANVEDLSLSSAAGAINGTGNDLDNWIAGNASANILAGLGGDDIILGGGGADIMSGGIGADRFMWGNAAETGLTNATADVITDFSFAAGDRIDLHYIDANAYAAGDQAFTFIGIAAFSGAPGEIRYYQSGGDTYIQMQTGTSVDVEGVIRLNGLHTPDASWFVL